MRRFDLVGVDGNAFSVMGYTARALRTAGLRDKQDEMRKKAMSGNYDNLLCVCMEYIDMANDTLEKQGVAFDEDEDYDYE